MAVLSSYYPQPVVAGDTAGTYAEGNDPRFGDGLEEAPAASQAEMEAGSEVGIRQMSPLRVAQAIEARLAAGIIIDGGDL